MNRETQDIWKIVEPVVAGAGLDLCEVQWNREGAGWVLRVFIDRPAPAAVPVDHADCVRVSRDLSATLDVSNRIAHTYHLEVSSPGLDRPLRREQDFSRFAGQRAHVRMLAGVEGRRNFTGVLRGAAGGLIQIDCDGRSFDLPVDDVAKANLVPDWDAELKRDKRNAERSAS